MRKAIAAVVLMMMVGSAVFADGMTEYQKMREQHEQLMQKLKDQKPVLLTAAEAEARRKEAEKKTVLIDYQIRTQADVNAQLEKLISMVEKSEKPEIDIRITTYPEQEGAKLKVTASTTDEVKKTIADNLADCRSISVKLIKEER